MFNQLIDTPIGWLNIKASDKGVVAIEFNADQAASQKMNTVTQQCFEQLSEYFTGVRRVFSVPLDMQGTAFQHQVWLALEQIDFGLTCSYTDIAVGVGSPKAVRAVGAANGRNPVPIIVPCHRVIGRSGKLTGYAGGIDTKAWLLTHEGANFLSK
ncbi:cysteine methyltransferase [Photobacterium frigidiphilum]|uniref:Methylated-DNA--protein-cysteine methyltransferase n=1 Tax=Photobacterium frigidiphilum TaxID=264736 RepID=A0A2T3JN48_9GAMM|nr:methylated-DNA--[protein]-cysteine S-methyltransferase [Photobacterium frigidiphilum]PSU50477.1 cysteine methyltransferase [Photobacterium frigidiphilum]